MTLLEVLQTRFPDSSKTTLRAMLQSDRVRVNGDVVRDAKRAVTSEDRVEVGTKTRAIDPRVAIVHEDDDLIVVHKASGLLTVATDTERDETAEAFLNAYAGARPGELRIHHVHRLDRDSSGVLVFAKNTWTRDRLQALFAAHDIDRIYVAVIQGALTPPRGTFRSHMAEDRSLRVKSVADERKGKEAITHYRVLASGRRYSLLELTLETGRRNQIRVHLAEAGHPILGDTMYGQGVDDPLRRLALHAMHLGFVHPRTGKKLSFTVPMPEGFRTVVT